MKFTVVVEKAEHNYSAYVPDLPGCITTGDSLEEIERMAREAIEFHIEGMRLDGEAVPEPSTHCLVVEVDVPEDVAEPRPATRLD
jgi:predicted RNase H-like HicB family nuclease